MKLIDADNLTKNLTYDIANHVANISNAIRARKQDRMEDVK